MICIFMQSLLFFFKTQMTVLMLSVKMVVRVMMMSTSTPVIVLQDLREITVKQVGF